MSESQTQTQTPPQHQIEFKIQRGKTTLKWKKEDEVKNMRIELKTPVEAKITDSNGKEHIYRYTVITEGYIDFTVEGIFEQLHELIEEHINEVKKIENAIMEFLANIKATVDVREFRLVVEDVGDC